MQDEGHLYREILNTVQFQPFMVNNHELHPLQYERTQSYVQSNQKISIETNFFQQQSLTT